MSWNLQWIDALTTATLRVSCGESTPQKGSCAPHGSCAEGSAVPRSKLVCEFYLQKKLTDKALVEGGASGSVTRPHCVRLSCRRKPTPDQ